MKVDFLFILIIFLTISAISYAQTDPVFESSNITVNTLIASSFISDSEGWAVDQTGTIWRTNDGCQSWRNYPAGGQKFTKLDFVSAEVGFALTKDSLYKTSNGSSTWKSIALPGEISNTICFLNDDTGFVSGYEETYQTKDGGNTWLKVATEGVTFKEYCFISSQIGLAAAYDDEYRCIWRTMDGGSTWSNVFNDVNYYINTICFTNESTGWAAGYYDKAGRGKQPVILRTDDAGISWEMVYINRHPGEVRGQEFLAIRFKNELEGFALAEYSENVFTTDGGVTWSLTYDLESALLPSYGIYTTLDGINELYLLGKEGYVTKWK